MESINRRKFMSGFLRGVGGLAIANETFSALLRKILSGKENLINLVEEIKNRYGIEIKIEEELNENEKKEAMIKLIREICKYPDFFFKKVRVNEISVEGLSGMFSGAGSTTSLGGNTFIKIPIYQPKEWNKNGKLGSIKKNDNIEEMFHHEVGHRINTSHDKSSFDFENIWDFYREMLINIDQLKHLVPAHRFEHMEFPKDLALDDFNLIKKILYKHNDVHNKKEWELYNKVQLVDECRADLFAKAMMGDLDKIPASLRRLIVDKFKLISDGLMDEKYFDDLKQGKVDDKY